MPTCLHPRSQQGCKQAWCPSTSFARAAAKASYLLGSLLWSLLESVAVIAAFTASVAVAFKPSNLSNFAAAACATACCAAGEDMKRQIGADRLNGKPEKRPMVLLAMGAGAK